MQISTHILDTSNGSPAAGVGVRLEMSIAAGSWKEISTGSTNPDGRHVFDTDGAPGVYRLTFSVEEYFKRTSTEYFFMDVPVVFKITDTQRKYHVPLLLNPFGYSTYRGS